jgi:hypothetical protein
VEYILFWTWEFSRSLIPYVMHIASLECEWFVDIYGVVFLLRPKRHSKTQACIITCFSVIIFNTYMFRFIQNSTMNELNLLMFIQTSSKKYTLQKKCFLPLAIRHVYGHCTRGELLATCKWPRKYTWWIRVTLIAQLAVCILIRAANWPRVLLYTRPTVKFFS